MRAPLAVVAAAFAVGIGLCWGMKATLPAIGIFLGASGLFFLTASRRKGRIGAHLALLGLIIGLGVFRAWVDQTVASTPGDKFATGFTDDKTRSELRVRCTSHSIASLLTSEPQPITVEGMLVSDPEWIRPAHGPARRQGWLEVTRIRNKERWISSQGRLLLKLHAHNVPLAYGDRVHLSGSIRGPRPLVKDEEEQGRGTFDEGDWLWIQGASGVLTIEGPEAIRRLSTEGAWHHFGKGARHRHLWIRYRRWVASFRWRLKDLGQSLLGPLEVAYLEAFLLGDGRGIPREVWDAFRRVGVVHIVASVL